MEKTWAEDPIDRKKKSNPLFYDDVKDTIDKIENLDQITDFNKLIDYIKNFENCDLKKNANTVIYSGNINSDLLIIGEAPGEEEDKQQVPFVGASGKLLKQMLMECNIDSENIYITNCVFWRPLMNRKPTLDEIKICKPMVLKQIEIIKPKYILLLGSVALNMLFDDTYMITKIRGQILQYENYTVLATFHPSYVLRMPKQKDLVLEDIRKLSSILNNVN